MSNSRQSLISLKILQTLQKIEDAERDDLAIGLTQADRDNHNNYQFFENPPESKIQDVVHQLADGRIRNSISNEFSDFFDDVEENPSKFEQFNTPAQVTHRTRTPFPPQQQQPESSTNLLEESLSVVTQQLKNIQETQDVVLAELRMDIEQLNCENLTLRLCNEKLIAENQHLQNIIQDLSKTSQILRDHLTGDYPGKKGKEDDGDTCHLSQKITEGTFSNSKILPSAEPSDRLILTPTFQRKQDDWDKSACDSVNGDLDSLWQSSVSGTTTTANTIINDSDTGIRNEEKKRQKKLDREEKRRCFEFLRRHKDKRQNHNPI